MTNLRISHTFLEKSIITVAFAELLLGGSGRVVMIGPLSLRIFILGCLLCYTLYLLFSNKLIANPSNVILLCILVDFAIMLIYSIINNKISDVIDSFTGYVVIAVCPVFIYLFKDNAGLLNWIRKLLYFCAVILSFITYLLWGLSLITSATSVILNSFQYGGLAYVGPIPRLFLKGSIFICCALFFALSDFLLTHNKKYLVMVAIFALAVIMTFTTSFYVFSLLLILISMYKLIGKEHFIKFLTIIILLGIIGLVVAYKAGIADVFIERFSGDYNFSYKGTQLLTVLDNYLESPLFGKGFGYSIKIDYGYIVDHTYSFEVMWSQLLLDTGIVGFTLFISHVMLTLYNLHKLFKSTGAVVFLSFELSLIMICLVSLTNPFMNNAIGLLFYAVCVGVSCMDCMPDHIEGGVVTNG